MQLFKRVLLSLFPDDIISQNVNPASMFVSFISTKEFFSVINRKIVENYKLNLFDVALDPFEFRVWFWEKPSIQTKDVDSYYGYCAAANLNGYRFVNLANMANSIALVTSVYIKDSMFKFPQEYFLHFLYSVYLISFVFLARIKIFPYQKKEENFNWFIETFFSFYEFIFEQTAKKYSPEMFWEIKNVLLKQADIFFMLYEFCLSLNKVFEYEDIVNDEFYSWIFYDELKKNNYKKLLNEYIKDIDNSSKKSSFSSSEKKFLSFVLPADILLRYLFADADIFLVTEHMVGKLYDKDITDAFVHSFRKDASQLEALILYITDYKHFKHNFFKNIQQYMIVSAKDEDNEISQEEMEELNDFMSSIWNDSGSLNDFKIPERIKKESKIMEKILNFYVTIVGWMRVARGDNFFARMFRKPLIESIVGKMDAYDDKKNTLNYYGALLYNYGKNVFYYKYASDNIRSGKQSFFVPYKSNFKNVYSNMAILRLFDENFLLTLLQDMNTKDVRLFIKNKKILEFFKSRFSQDISHLVTLNKKSFLSEVYYEVDELLPHFKNFPFEIAKHIDENDFAHIKDNLYHFDFWLVKSFYSALVPHKKELWSAYSDLSIMGILASLKETLFGFLIYICFVIDYTKLKKKKIPISLLFEIYVGDVLNVSPDFKKIFVNILVEMQKEYSDIFAEWITLDDNTAFFSFAYRNWASFFRWKDPEKVVKSIVGEDIVWFRWFLKNITYYNKRFLVAKS